jgi:hypothetical protein
MIKVYKLTERIASPDFQTSSDEKARQLKFFALTTCHGLGRIDFCRCVLEMTDEEYEDIVSKCGKYARFKLGNILKYHEIEIYAEHAIKLKDDMPECKLRKVISKIEEGFITIRKE